MFKLICPEPKACMALALEHIHTTDAAEYRTAEDHDADVVTLCSAPDQPLVTDPEGPILSHGVAQTPKIPCRQLISCT